MLPEINENKNSLEVDINVDCSSLDVAIEKANRLVELLREASSIIDSLQVNGNTAKQNNQPTPTTTFSGQEVTVMAFFIMRIYHAKNRVFNDAGRAIIRSRSAYSLGTPVMFSKNGKDYFGDVIECIQAPEGSELYKFLESLCSRGAYMYIPPGGLKDESDSS